MGCGDVAVWPGDILVGDREGVFVMPADIANEIANEAVEMAAFENFATEQLVGGETIIGLYPVTKQEAPKNFAEWREVNGRLEHARNIR